MTPRRSDLVSAFTKKVIVQGVAAKRHVDPYKYALNRWGNVLCPEWNERAAVAGASTVDGAFKSESQAFFDLAFEASVPGRLGARRVPFDVRVTSITTGSSASWVKEGQGKPITRASLAAAPLAARKIVAAVVLSDEALSGGGEAAEALVRNDLARACTDGLNEAFLSSNADDGETPGGILNNVSVTSGGDNIQGSLAALLDEFSGDLTRAIFVANPGVFAGLSAVGFQRIGLNGGFLMGATAIASRFAPADVLIILDPEMVAIAGGDVSIRSSKNATMQMESVPTQASFDDESPPAPTATNVVSAYQTNSVAMLAEIATNWSVQNSGVAALDVSSWSGVSP
jgi:hypothetical protein